MNQLTLEQALELVHPWLGTWSSTQLFHGHTFAKPPATDELAMRVLRQLAEEGQEPELDCRGHRQWYCTLADSALAHDQTSFDDPRDAIIIAAAMWLQSRKGKTA